MGFFVYMHLTFFILLYITIFLFFVNIAILWWFSKKLISLFAGGGPYVPSREDQVACMISIAKIQPTDRIVDLGSGDGRLLIAGVQAGALHATGYEILPSLVRQSKKKIMQLPLNSRITILRQSFWHANLSDATVVFLYQIPYAMKRLERLLQNELPEGARVVSNAFSFPNWKPEKTEQNIFLYTIPSSRRVSQ